MSLIEQLGGCNMTELEFKNMSDDVAKIGLIVVRVNKSTKPKLWKIIGKSNVFKNHFVCDAKDELLNHFDCGELRLATDAEIKAGRRLDLEVLHDHDIPPNTIILER